MWMNPSRRNPTGIRIQHFPLSIYSASHTTKIERAMERTLAADGPLREHPLKTDADKCLRLFNEVKNLASAEHPSSQPKIQAELVKFEEWAGNMKVFEKVPVTPYPGVPARTQVCHSDKIVPGETRGLAY
ncbi:hypothetical protein FQN51_004163 [Onygenales sp. PD_10]|nr:hypothetical protein FQN51_004163 [Onygenales sp. PD_10]